MIKFNEYEGKLFRMLEENEIVPLKENDVNVLVRFITHGVIGEYVMEHWLDCNQKNVPIYVEDVDSDGDVTVWIDENRNEHHCCPFPMFEIIGTFVEEGSAEWGEYQTQQGVVVRHKHGCVIRPEYDSPSRAAIFEHYPTGWQIYVEPEQPKPLLADAKVGDLVKLRNGRYSQIVEVKDGSVFKYQNPEAIERSRVALFWCDENGDTSRWGKVKDVDIIFTEPLAPEGTAEWAWQMMLLGNKVRHKSYVMPNTHCAMNEKRQIVIFTTPSSMIYGGDVICHANDWLWFLSAYGKIHTWQLYEPKPEPQPAKEPIANCENCKHVCANSNIDHCHMYEPKHESENIIHGHIPADMRLKYIDLVRYKVGDSVICEYHRSPLPKQISYERVIDVDDVTVITQSQNGSVCVYDINGNHGDINGWHIDRVISPCEHIVTIGCLSGTVRPVSTNGIHIWFHLIDVNDRIIATIRISSLDTQTRELVESLLEAMRGES